MRCPLHEAAARLGLHPANLMIRLAEIGAPFHEIWPEIDQHWLDRLQVVDLDAIDDAGAADTETVSH